MMRFGMEPPSPFYNSSYYCASCVLGLGFLSDGVEACQGEARGRAEALRVGVRLVALGRRRHALSEWSRWRRGGLFAAALSFLVDWRLQPTGRPADGVRVSLSLSVPYSNFQGRQLCRIERAGSLQSPVRLPRT